jgi:hypothetical protein
MTKSEHTPNSKNGLNFAPLADDDPTTTPIRLGRNGGRNQTTRSIAQASQEDSPIFAEGISPPSQPSQPHEETVPGRCEKIVAAGLSRHRGPENAGDMAG